MCHKGSILLLKPKSGVGVKEWEALMKAALTSLRSFLVTSRDEKASILSSCLGILQYDNSAHTQSLDI